MGVNGEIIKDVVTGYEWQRCSVGQTCDGTAGLYYWNTAMANWPATAEWRLPTIAELRTLVYCSTGTPILIDMTADWPPCSGTYQIPTITSWSFPKTTNSAFWSSSPSASYSDTSWGVDFYHGFVASWTEEAAFYVRLVRGGQ